ncbi:uncharacterized protein [Epargyreus clarus]|uniref:uncharacterized protein n=1 Tax=Epargyreus clarus TaxID=520877 RepID=UPI003C2B520F
MNGSESEDSNNEIVPASVNSSTLNLLPSKSKKLYSAAYEAFKKWRKENKSNSLCEDALLTYFVQLSTKYAPPSLWATYSMLKYTINTYDQIDIGGYNKLTAFLKKKNLGYQPKKSQVFSRENISKFLNEAPDDIYLCEKVALIFGISGALRREEFVNITVDDVKKVEDDVLLVLVRRTQNNVPRSFTIMNELFHLCWKYRQARPENCSVDRFFLRYTKGVCIPQAVGINKFGSMPRDIAEYLHLPDAHNFTGHSFRRTSVTLLVDGGADITSLQRRRGWKSAAVAFGNIGDSVNNKRKNSEQITDEMETIKRTETAVVDIKSKYGPSTSGLNSSENILNEERCASTAREIMSLLKEEKVNLSKSINQMSAPSISEAKTIIEIQPDEPKGAILYHPDIGLYIQNLTNETEPRPNHIFNNCSITINNPSGNLIFNNCTTKRMETTVNKAVQTDESC